MSDGLVVFEDDRWAELSPVADLTPVPFLRLGRGTLAARWHARAGCGPLLAVACRGPAEEAGAAAGVEGPVLAVNAAALPGPWLAEVRARPEPARYACRGRLAAAWLRGREVEALVREGLAALHRASAGEREVEVEFLERPWDLVSRAVAALEQDAGPLRAGVAGEVDPRAALLAPERIRIEAGARVEALAVLDAREGFIRIGARAAVGPGTRVHGPCDVGEGTELLGGLIARSTFGPQCRIAGEVEECVFQGYANKRHHGFIGHSVVGEWVNLGALTTTSDLKNNYGEVRSWAAGGPRATGLTKLGALIGAHVKTGIGTLLPTGASIGVGANLFGGGRFAPRRVPSFGWWDGERMAEHRLEEMLATARIAVSRRGCALGPEDERRIREAFASSAGERAAGT